MGGSFHSYVTVYQRLSEAQNLVGGAITILKNEPMVNMVFIWLIKTWLVVLTILKHMSQWEG